MRLELQIMACLAVEPTWEPPAADPLFVVRGPLEDVALQLASMAAGVGRSRGLTEVVAPDALILRAASARILEVLQSRRSVAPLLPGDLAAVLERVRLVVRGDPDLGTVRSLAKSLRVYGRDGSPAESLLVPGKAGRFGWLPRLRDRMDSVHQVVASLAALCTIVVGLILLLRGTVPLTSMPGWLK